MGIKQVFNQHITLDAAAFVHDMIVRETVMFDGVSYQIVRGGSDNADRIVGLTSEESVWCDGPEERMIGGVMFHCQLQDKVEAIYEGSKWLSYLVENFETKPCVFKLWVPFTSDSSTNSPKAG